MPIKPIAEYEFCCWVCAKPAVTCQPTVVVQVKPIRVQSPDTGQLVKMPRFEARGAPKFTCREHATMPVLSDGDLRYDGKETR